MTDEEYYDFYGAECEGCAMVAGFIDTIEKDQGVKFRKLEVWHNSRNQSTMMEFSKDRCHTVPMLYNKRTDSVLCGSPTKDDIEKWVREQKSK
jgi:hypothetical protein